MTTVITNGVSISVGQSPNVGITVGPIGPTGPTGPVGPIGPVGPAGPPGSTGDAAALAAHIVNPEPHSAYDIDMPSLVLLYENRLVG